MRLQHHDANPASASNSKKQHKKKADASDDDSDDLQQSAEEALLLQHQQQYADALQSANVNFQQVPNPSSSVPSQYGDERCKAEIDDEEVLLQIARSLISDHALSGLINMPPVPVSTMQSAHNLTSLLRQFRTVSSSGGLLMSEHPAHFDLNRPTAAGSIITPL